MTSQMLSSKLWTCSRGVPQSSRSVLRAPAVPHYTRLRRKRCFPCITQATSTLDRPAQEQKSAKDDEASSLREHENIHERQRSGQEASTSSHAESLLRGSGPSSRRLFGLDQGVWIAAGLLTSWATMINVTVFHTTLGSLQAWLLFWPMVQLHTGVFITAHDAMHGAVAPTNPKLNQFMGRLAGTLYAGLDYDSMRHFHHEHHAHTGYLEKDPDFHAGDPSLPAWAGKFIKRYLTVKQMVILNVMVGAIQLSGAPYLNMVIFLLCAGLISAAQLFYFGTFVPHKPPKTNPGEVMTWQKSNPTWAKTRLASWLTCYHFDCHVEHHAHPRLPWYELWGERKKSLSRPGEQ